MKLINRHPEDSNWTYIGPFGYSNFIVKGYGLRHALKSFEFNFSVIYWPKPKDKPSWANPHRWDWRISPRQLTLWHGYSFVAWYFPGKQEGNIWGKAGFDRKALLRTNS